MPKHRFLALFVLLALILMSGCENGKSKSSTKDESSDTTNQTTMKASTEDSLNNLTKSQFVDFDDYDLSSGEPVSVGDGYYLYSKLTDVLSKETYGLDNLILSFKIVNDSDSEASSDSSFQIEVELNGEWFIIPPTDYNFDDLYGFYPEHGEYNYSIDLSEINYNFTAGNYRLLKIYSIEDFDGTIICESKFRIV